MTPSPAPEDLTTLWTSARSHTASISPLHSPRTLTLHLPSVDVAFHYRHSAGTSILQRKTLTKPWIMIDRGFGNLLRGIGLAVGCCVLVKLFCRRVSGSTPSHHWSIRSEFPERTALVFSGICQPLHLGLRRTSRSTAFDVRGRL